MEKFWGLAEYDCGPGGFFRFWKVKPTVAQLLTAMPSMPRDVANDLVEIGSAYDGVDYELSEIRFEGES